MTRKTSIAAGLLVCGLIALLILWPRRPQASITSRGGAVIRFEGVTAGTNMFVYGNLLEKAWGKVFGNRVYYVLGHRFAGPYVNMTTGVVGFVFTHFSIIKPNQLSSPGFALPLLGEHSIGDVTITFEGTNKTFWTTGNGSSAFSDRIGFAAFDLYIPPTHHDVIRVMAKTSTNAIELGRFEVPLK